MIQAAPVLPGETLAGKYRVERVLGEGGMGIVVVARHLDLDERVAIKFLLGEPKEDVVERFTHEARAAVKVKGEHVCRVFDFGRLETGEPYIVMEYMEGTDLARKVSHEGRQPASLVAGWMIEACDAIADAHALGIVHRDLKPANIFLANRADGSNRAKVLDFGISKLPGHQLTRTNAMIGSPAYMSPEQLESAREVDVRADIWSIGVMLYELLTGKPPFVADNLVALAFSIREHEPEPMADVPDGLAEVTMKCLAKKTDERYGSAAELALALAPFAPPEVAGIVSRLRRRMTEATVSTGRNLEELDGARLPSKAVLDIAQETFAPLQTSHVTPIRSKWPAVILTSASAIGALALALVLARRDAAPPTNATGIASGVHVEPPAQPSLSVSPTGDAPAMPSTIPSAAPVVSTKPVVSVARPSFRPAPTASTAASALAQPVSVASAPGAPAPPPPPSTKRRQLDREDP